MTGPWEGPEILGGSLPGALVALSASRFHRPSTDASFRPTDAVWDGIITASSVSKEPAPVDGLDLQTPIARSDPVVTSGPVTCDERLGGLLREYSRAPMPAAA
jgi:hypothetical protein